MSAVNLFEFEREFKRYLNRLEIELIYLRIALVLLILATRQVAFLFQIAK